MNLLCPRLLVDTPKTIVTVQMWVMYSAHTAKKRHLLGILKRENLHHRSLTSSIRKTDNYLKHYKKRCRTWFWNTSDRIFNDCGFRNGNYVYPCHPTNGIAYNDTPVWNVEDFRNVERYISGWNLQPGRYNCEGRPQGPTDQIKSLVKSNKELLKENMSLKAWVTALESKADQAEQYSRRNCLRIAGVEETDEENTDNIVLSIAHDIGIRGEYINRSHRLGNPKKKKENQAQGNYSQIRHLQSSYQFL